MHTDSRNILVLVIVVLVVLVGALWFLTHQGGSTQISNLPTATSTLSSASSTSATSSASHVVATTNDSGTAKKSTSSSSVTITGSTGTAGHPIVAPRIIEFLPAAGTTGTVVTIEGTNFDSTTNYVTFGTSAGRHHQDGTADNVIAVVGSKDGWTLTFTVPSTGASGLLCDAQNNCVAIAATRIQAGEYPVTVTTKAGVSNTAVFTVLPS